jgi:antitoxin PrlF
MWPPNMHRLGPNISTIEMFQGFTCASFQFLARDMTNDPGKSIAALPSTLRDRIVALTENMDVDLDAEIDGDVAL